MAQSYIHAQASARHFKAGTPEDYLPIHEWIDKYKSTMGDIRHRAMRHHAQGPWDAQEVFGVYIEVWSEQKQQNVKIMVRDIAENHIVEDLGWIPSPSDWLECMNCLVWMGGKRNKYVGREEILNSVQKEGKKDE